MIKFISPEPPGDQRNPALSTISPTVYPAPSCPCPCTVGPSLVKLLPRHGVVYPLPHCRFKQVLNYSLLLDNNPIQPCVFSLQILNNLFSPDKFFSCFFSRILSWTSFPSTMWLPPLLVQFPKAAKPSQLPPHFSRLFQLPLAWKWPTLPLHIFILCATLWKYLLLKSSRMNKAFDQLIRQFGIGLSAWHSFCRTQKRREKFIRVVI